MSEGRTAAGGFQRMGSGWARLVRAWKALPHESRQATVASVVLFLTLFLPWYQVTLIAPEKSTKLESASATITGWGAFSFVEAAILLVAAGVLTLLFQRAEGRAFHLPGGDGGVITAAGLWTCALIVWRIFDKQGATTNGPSATTSGIEWGIFVALASAAFLAYSGSRIRAAHRPEPPLPGGAGAPAGSNAAATTDVMATGRRRRPERERRPATRDSNVERGATWPAPESRRTVPESRWPTPEYRRPTPTHRRPPQEPTSPAPELTSRPLEPTSRPPEPTSRPPQPISPPPAPRRAAEDSEPRRRALSPRPVAADDPVFYAADLRTGKTPDRPAPADDRRPPPADDRPPAAAPDAPPSPAPAPRRRHISADELFEHVEPVDPPAVPFGRIPPAGRPPLGAMEQGHDQTLPPGDDDTLPRGADDTLPLGDDATLPLGGDDTVPRGRDVAPSEDDTLQLGGDDTLSLGGDDTLPRRPGDRR